MTEETGSGQDEERIQDSVDTLIARIGGLHKRRRFRSWFIPSIILLALTVAMAWLRISGNLESGWLALVSTILICGTGSWIWIMAERRERHAIESLSTCKELRALRGLLINIDFCSRKVRNDVNNTILELLPLLKEDDSVLLDVSQREALNALLYGKSTELSMAVLSALEQVGDGTALPYLTSIAAGKGVPEALWQQRSSVQERAQHTVASIRDRIERQNRANVLLRASQDPGTPIDQLVRPVGNKPFDDGQELLRPEVSIQHDDFKKEEEL